MGFGYTLSLEYVTVVIKTLLLLRTNLGRPRSTLSQLARWRRLSPIGLKRHCPFDFFDCSFVSREWKAHYGRKSSPYHNIVFCGVGSDFGTIFMIPSGIYGGSSGNTRHVRLRPRSLRGVGGEEDRGYRDV